MYLHAPPLFGAIPWKSMYSPSPIFYAIGKSFHTFGTFFHYGMKKRLHVTDK